MILSQINQNLGFLKICHAFLVVAGPKFITISVLWRISHRQDIYEELLKKEGEISGVKMKARQLMLGRERSAGYTEMKQQLQLLG